MKGMEDYFDETKKKLEEKIPDFGSKDFEMMRYRIREELKRKETEFLLLIRSLKILVLGDWFTPEKKQLIYEIKNTLLKNGLYAETIDSYYDMGKKGGLPKLKILEACCIKHQVIVFIDGEGKGTITEQNYLSEKYYFHGKILFFIEESKFDRLKDNPSEYIKSFPTIITYNDGELADKVLIYSRLRIYRLAAIIDMQSSTGRGLRSPDYVSWKDRLSGRKP